MSSVMSAPNQSFEPTFTGTGVCGSTHNGPVRMPSDSFNSCSDLVGLQANFSELTGKRMEIALLDRELHFVHVSQGLPWEFARTA